MDSARGSSHGRRAPLKRKSRSAYFTSKAIVLSILVSAAPVAMAQNCVSLAGSTSCPAFSNASVSTSGSVQSLYPFLQFVSSRQDFDKQLEQYISTTYTQEKYQNLLGCPNVNLSNTTDYYARYTTSVICNAIVQNSKQPCSLSEANSRPLCAESCAEQAISEQTIISMNTTCSSPGRNAVDQIRADFTVCSLPANSLSGNCIEAASNEPNDCGFANNLIGLCMYCAKSSPNATDSCCYHSNVTRCDSINIPATSALPPLALSTSSSSSSSGTASAAAATSSAAGGKGGGGLSGGAIAGIVVGAVLGAALLLGLIIFLCVFIRRRRGSQSGSIFNQPTPVRKSGNGMTFNPVSGTGPPQQGYEVLPGGRIARMSALEGTSGNSPPRGTELATGAAAGAAAGGIAGARQRHGDNSSSDGYGTSPDSRLGGRLGAPPAGIRNGSLSSGSVLAGADPDSQSPQSGSGGDYSSPQGMASQQSEQLPFFKDYYSQDEIHPNDKVSVLWAYQPRAGDEFELERGDMLKVVGIWDDGWATGVRLTERAEDWDVKRKVQRDSGVSNASAGRRTSSPPPPGEIKAFPLVCVCLPEHWKKTIEGDGSTETGSSTAPQAGP